MTPPPNGRAVSLAAKAAAAAGISVMPPREDGTKKPLGPWKQYQAKRPNAAQLRAWWSKGLRTGLIAICGKVSGNLELLEFETAEVWERYRAAAVALGSGPLLARIAAGCSEKPPGGGMHVLYRCPTIGGNTRLACHPGKLLPSGKHEQVVDIETRGEGGYVIVAPSFGKVHPSGRPYVQLAGGFDTILAITPEERAILFGLARSFDTMPEGQGAGDDPFAMTAPKKGNLVARSGSSIRVGDDFMARTPWEDILPEGWQVVHTQGETRYWRRPGKSDSWSATTNHNGTDCLHVFTSNSPFPPNKSYTKLGAFALLNHGGDFKLAVKALASVGYGSPNNSNQKLTNGSLGDGSGALGRLGDGSGAFEGSPSAPKAPKDTKAPNHPNQELWSGLSDADLGMLDLSTVTPKDVRWLLKNRIPLGKFTLVAGEGGLGKTFLLLSIAAGISTGGPCPGGDGERYPLGDVIILTAEDDPEDTIVPRLISMGADLKRIVVLGTAKLPSGNMEPIRLSDIDRLREVLKRRPETKLIFVDPMPSFLGRGVDDGKNADLREILTPLGEFAAEHELSVTGVTHFNKTANARAAQRVMGSVAYSNVARATWCLVEDPETEGRRLFLPLKNNLSPERNNGLAFTIVDGAVVWEDETIRTPINEVLGGSSGGNSGAKELRAIAFLKELLTGQRLPSDEVITRAKERGFAKNFIWEVKPKAGVRAEKNGFTGGWNWTIDPPTEPQAEPDPDFGPLPERRRLRVVSTTPEAGDPSSMAATNGHARNGAVNRFADDDEDWTKNP